MAATPDLDAYLLTLGFDPDASYECPLDPGTAALMGVNAFIREHAPSDEFASIGVTYNVGPSA